MPITASDTSTNQTEALSEKLKANSANHSAATAQSHATSATGEKLNTEVNTHSEAIAKRQLIETLQAKNMPAYQPGENTKVVLERATQGAREELATMQKQNPGASYAEMLQRVKPEEKQQITQSKGHTQAIAV